MKLITLIFLLIAPSLVFPNDNWVFGSDKAGDLSSTVFICKTKQALGLPKMDSYSSGFKYIQDLPSQAEYVLKPLKNVLNVNQLTRGKAKGYFTHKFNSKGSIIYKNYEDYQGLCWVHELENPISIDCSYLYSDYHPALESIENGRLSNTGEINKMMDFFNTLGTPQLRIHDGRFIANNRTFRDCDNPYCVRKPHVLLERGICEFY